MEETLGKRIAYHRKALGLTQDQLAEKLGVTAQAVSKWENDQSCPDITTLPKLAEIFSTTTDELLGVAPQKLVPAEAADQEESRFEFQFDDGKKDHNFEFHYDAGRKGGIGLALWILLTAGLLLFSEFFYSTASGFWDCLWSAGLLVFGLFGLYPKFSVFRLGCALFGGYAVANLFFGVIVARGLWLPLLLLLFGLSLLVDALRKPGKGYFHIGKPNMVNKMDIDGETFHCATSFGEDDHRPQMQRLSGGMAEVSFGELTVDLSGCREIAPDNRIALKCAFGQLNILIPRGCRAEWTVKKAFGNLDVKGTPDPSAQTAIYLDCDVSFGEIVIHYL